MFVFILNIIIYRCAEGWMEAKPTATAACVVLVCHPKCASCKNAGCLSCTLTKDTHRNAYKAGADACSYLF